MNEQLFFCQEIWSWVLFQINLVNSEPVLLFIFFPLNKKTIDRWKKKTQCIFYAFWDNLAKILCEHITRLNNKRFSCSSNEQRALCGDCLISAHQFRKVRYCYLKHKTKTKFQMYWTNNWNGTSTHPTNLHYKKKWRKINKATCDVIIGKTNMLKFN